GVRLPTVLTSLPLRGSRQNTVPRCNRLNNCFMTSIMATMVGYLGLALADQLDAGLCESEALRTYQVQGSGQSSEWRDSFVSLVALVTEGYRSEQGGFYVEDAFGDADAATSDGLFVAVERDSTLALTAVAP